MDGEKQEDSNSRSAVTASFSASAAVTMATVCPGSSVCTRAPSSSLSIISPDRPAVQVVQHAIQRPQNLAAQLLQQMYAAQQQHLMLQTAALQQHSPHLQSLATIQASMCQRQSTSSSSNGLIHQPAGVSISLPASPVTAQLVGRTQNSISSGVSATISQQHCLLGGRPTNCNQAQMYLRTQMLILTPAASVAPVQSDLPAVTSCSSASNASRGLVLHHLPGALATALTPAAPKTSVHSLKSSQVSENSSERGQSEVTGSQVLTPALYPAQTALKQQQFCPPGHQVAHCQLTPQQAAGAALNPRQLQSVTASVSPQDTSSYPSPFLSKSQSSPAAQSQTARSAPASSSLTSASSAQTSVPAARVQPQLPPLMAAPQRRSSFPQVQSCPPPPPPLPPAPPLVLPRFPQNPPGALQRLLLHSVQALAVQTQQVVLKEQEPSATEGLVQTPYQSLPPPQTEAVDLKVQPVPSSEPPLPGQTCKGNSSSLSQKRDESPRPSSQSSPPFPGSLKQNGGVVDSSSNLSSHSMIRPLAAEEPSHLTTSNSSNGAPPSPTQPPHILHAAVRCPSHPPSSPSSPIGPLTTHVLTHLIEGFVIQEGLEPFPVVPSSLLKKKQASLPDSQEINTNQDAAREERPLEANQPDSSDSEMEYSGPAADVAEHGERVGGMLRCEYCGARGYTRISLRSKRFCSMMCVRRFSKHIALLRAGRWGHRAAGRRGRPPSRVSGYPREHFLKRIYRSEKTREGREEEDEEEAPAPMTTRLRKRAERRREKATGQEREQERPIAETISISDEAEEDRCPSHWDVEQVFSYIKSLPGGEDVAEEFRSQEIDGQALLLLTEDHLVSTMNLKLGPALKLYAHINSLKDS